MKRPEYVYLMTNIIEKQRWELGFYRKLSFRDEKDIQFVSLQKDFYFMKKIIILLILKDQIILEFQLVL